MKTFIYVPFEEKERAKDLGARWDMSQQRWYVPDGVDLALFVRWLPKHLRRGKTIEALSPAVLKVLEERVR